VGKKAWSLKTLRTADMGMFLHLFIDLLGDKPVPPVEFQWVSKDGNLGWGEGRASLIKIDSKKTEVLLSVRDITERKQMEKDLRGYSKNMERLAEERAIKLLESEKLVVAGTIASTVAHDLRGPLNTIMNAVYLMDTKPEKSDEMKAIILKAVENASKMLNEVRSKTASEMLTFEELDVATFIELIIKETPIPQRIEVKTNLEHQMVKVDRLKIRRVIENLIRNAVEAMPKKGSLQISNRVEGEKLVIEVRDSGVGIPKERINSLFKPFNTTKENGTGLGLHYCKKTMEDHGGDIEVKSEVGSGTTIILKIPMTRRLSNVAVVSAVGD
jgi:signal transduction histidine kinase